MNGQEELQPQAPPPPIDYAQQEAMARAEQDIQELRQMSEGGDPIARSVLALAAHQQRLQALATIEARAATFEDPADKRAFLRAATSGEFASVEGAARSAKHDPHWREDEPGVSAPQAPRRNLEPSGQSPTGERRGNVSARRTMSMEQYGRLLRSDDLTIDQKRDLKRRAHAGDLKLTE